MRFENGSLDNEIIKEEMLVFVPLCVNENVDECLLIGCDSLSSSASKLVNSISSAKTLTTRSEFESEKFAVIISFDENINLQEVFRILKKDGIVCMKATADIRDGLTKLSEYYRIVMPYHNMELIFASNKYHPTADLILDKSDFIESAEYYNSDIHLASFVVYEKAKKALKGIVKS